MIYKAELIEQKPEKFFVIFFWEKNTLMMKFKLVNRTIFINYQS